MTGSGTLSGPQPLTVDRLIAETHRILEHSGVTLGHSKVVRIVRDFKRHVAPNGYPYENWLVTQVQLHHEQREAVLEEFRRVICYRDPTGEAASTNVDRSRGVRYGNGTAE